MHAKPDLRVFLKWMIIRSGSVITDVIPLKKMDDQTLIRSDLENSGIDHSSMSISGVGQTQLFQKHRIYIVRGGYSQFEFVSLPNGSYCYYSVRHASAICLTRKNLEIQNLLQREWDYLPSLNLSRVVEFVLNFYDGGIKNSHHVINDLNDLNQMDGQHRKINRAAIQPVSNEIGSTTITLDNDVYKIRAITLMGWMHAKQDLGIERLSIHRTGEIEFDAREVLCQNTFTKLPGILY